MLKYLVVEKILSHLYAVTPCCAGQHRLCILSLLQPFLALPGRLRKEFGSVDSPATSGLQKSGLKLPFSPDLVHMEGKPSSAWQTAAGGATGCDQFAPLCLEINRPEEKNGTCGKHNGQRK